MKQAIAGILALLFLCVYYSSAAGESISTPAGTLSFSAEALAGWMKDSPAPPPLVSTGLLGQPGTSVLLGGKDLDTDVHPGMRVTAAYWDKDKWGILASVLYLSSQSVSQSFGSSGQIGSLNLATPFYNVLLPGEDSAMLSLAGRFSGQAQEELNASLWSAELMAAGNLMSTRALRLDILGGFRYLNLNENFSFTTNRSFFSNSILPPGAVFQTKDQFDTTNNFYGAQVGVLARSGTGPWTVSGTAKLALGAMVQSVDIDGDTLITGAGAPQTFTGGFFALPSNMGSHARTVFGVLPEFGLNLGYDVTSRMTLFLGYTFLFTNNVVRPGDQIDRVINPNLFPPSQLLGPARPEFTAHDSTFRAQGISAGFVFRF